MTVTAILLTLQLGFGQFSDFSNLAPLFPEVIYREDLVDSMRKFLWPDAPLSIALGPEDGVYYSLSQAEIDDLISFWKARREFIAYIPEAWDCDDFAREFLYLSRVWSVRLNGILPIAPAVGAAFVRIDGPYGVLPNAPMARAYHVLNAILRDDGQWFFFEPQTGDMVPIEGPIFESVTVLKIQL